MTHLPIPLSVLYAGLAGTVLALVVATATNKWSPRVFFLLTLRLAIGWHFLFEGLYKVQSYDTGPTDTNKPFSSEPYFRVAPGPFGAKMRKEFSDPAAEIAARVKAPEDIPAAEFAKLPVDKQAEKCPAAVAKQIDEIQARSAEALKAEAESELADIETRTAQALKDIDDTEQRALLGKWTPDEVAQLHLAAEQKRGQTRAAADARRAEVRTRLVGYEQLRPYLLRAVKAESGGETLLGPLEAALNAFKAQADADLEKIAAEEKKEIESADSAEQRAFNGEWTDGEKKDIRSKADDDRKKLKEKAEKDRQDARDRAVTPDRVPQKIVAAKARYARWVYGVDFRDCTLKGINGSVSLSAPQRLEHVEWVRAQARAAEARQTDGLGNGTGTDAKRVAEFRTDALAAETDLARDANAFLAELTKELNGGKAVDAPAETSRGQLLDRVTMWFLVAVGAALMAGLFTRLACLLATGFLVLTYLTHPAFPWYPQPPNTEGNPLFINKNAIEALALLTLACYPTGRWLGFDALVMRPFFKYDREKS